MTEKIKKEEKQKDKPIAEHYAEVARNFIIEEIEEIDFKIKCLEAARNKLVDVRIKLYQEIKNG